MKPTSIRTLENVSKPAKAESRWAPNNDDRSTGVMEQVNFELGVEEWRSDGLCTNSEMVSGKCGE